MVLLIGFLSQNEILDTFAQQRYLSIVVVVSVLIGLFLVCLFLLRWAYCFFVEGSEKKMKEKAGDGRPIHFSLDLIIIGKDW